MKIAIPRTSSGSALYHEKFGLAEGPAGRTAFFGSANETRSGYLRNFELVQSYEADRSPEDREQIRTLDLAFASLWSNTTSGLDVLDLHDAFSRGLLQAASEGHQDDLRGLEMNSKLEVPRETLRRPDEVRLRPFQEQAIAEWFAKNGRGILAMATGSGKTITALSAAEAVLQRAGPPLVVVIVAPYLHLVSQWIREAGRFGLRPIECSGASPAWREEASSAVFSANQGRSPVVSLITTNATFSSTGFQSIIRQLRVRTLLIADEVHNLGASKLARSLPESISLRLGLSATPERRYDVTGSQVLEKYFGGVAFRFDLKEAIRSDPPVLTPYRYFPVLVELEPDEAEEYQRLTDAIARQMRDADDDSLSAVALALLLKRSRLVATARGKLEALRNAISPYAADAHTIVYCGDGSLEIEALDDHPADSEAGIVVRQLAGVVRLLGFDLHMNVASYTADTPLPEREQLRLDFASGRKQALVAIRCLDEGVDFPEARRAFILASSTNPRQFIQRRGRLLRRALGKDSADIFDFIVVPPSALFDTGSAEWKVMQRLVRREMERVIEFASIATNGPQARAVLLPMLQQLRLLDMA